MSGCGGEAGEQNEPPTSQREAWLDEIRDAVGDLPRQLEDLRFGMRKFGPDFDADDWQRAYDSEDVAERDRCKTANLGLILGMGDLNTIIQNGAVLAGLMPVGERKRNAPAHYRRLVDADVLAESERDELTAINRARNGVTHHYARASASEAHAAIAGLDRLLSADLPGRLNDWLTGLGM